MGMLTSRANGILYPGPGFLVKLFVLAWLALWINRDNRGNITCQITRDFTASLSETYMHY